MKLISNVITLTDNGVSEPSLTAQLTFKLGDNVFSHRITEANLSLTDTQKAALVTVFGNIRRVIRATVADALVLEDDAEQTPV